MYLLSTLLLLLCKIWRSCALSGIPPTDEEVLGPYPTVITPEKSPEDRVLIVQDFIYANYLGLLHVTFDDDGKIISYDGNPVLLDASVEQGNVDILHSTTLV